MDDRQQALLTWVQQHLGTTGTWSVVSGDASFRRYFRFVSPSQSFIAVDAPPEKENTERFVALATALRKNEVAVPHIIASDIASGFMLQQDLGNEMLLPLLSESTADMYYSLAMQALYQWQGVHSLALVSENYNHGRLALELGFMPEWFLGKHLDLAFSAEEHAMYQRISALLLSAAHEQPLVLTHRDFHARNLMFNEGAVFIIDFQDAVWGPASYDLVSFLKDCYIEWPYARVCDWALAFKRQHPNDKIKCINDAQWLKWFDWMGLQRHLKVLGIFARLAHRDGKHHYLKDLPLTLRYCMETASRYEELAPLARYLNKIVAPRFDEVQKAPK